MTPRRNTLVTDVDELINPVTGDWDVERVKKLFGKRTSASNWLYWFLKAEIIF
jgi:hypothetical protein